MSKRIVPCPKCQIPLRFRTWSKRYEKASRWREALADCPNGCGKYAQRYFDGEPTSEPYQVRAKATKTAHCSAKAKPERKAAIIALWGSFQNFVDNVNILPGVTQQYKS